MSKLRILLVRHGESEANVQIDWYRTIPDHAIHLTKRGKKQAATAGEELIRYLNDSHEASFNGRIRIWNSPYSRTRQTRDIIAQKIAEYPGNYWNIDYKEHLLLHEQKFGLFDGISDEDLPILFPAEHAHYEKHKAYQGKFWVRMPLGESRADVCQRVHQSFGTFHRDKDKHDINTIIVVAHGTVNRAFVTMWLSKPYEWCNDEPNPGNCSIRLLEDGKDKGYIFTGYKDGKLI